MDSPWTHAICERCWFDSTTEGDTIRIPTRVRHENPYVVERCCFCRHPTIVGIYVRRDPNDMTLPTGDACHPIDKEEETI